MLFPFVAGILVFLLAETLLIGFLWAKWGGISISFPMAIAQAIALDFSLVGLVLITRGTFSQNTPQDNHRGSE